MFDENIKHSLSHHHFHINMFVSPPPSYSIHFQLLCFLRWMLFSAENSVVVLQLDIKNKISHAYGELINLSKSLLAEMKKYQLDNSELGRKIGRFCLKPQTSIISSCSIQGCREKRHFSICRWNYILKMSLNLEMNCYGFATGCWKLFFICRVPQT